MNLCRDESVPEQVGVVFPPFFSHGRAHGCAAAWIVLLLLPETMWCLRLLLLVVLLPWSSSVKRGRTPAGILLSRPAFHSFLRLQPMPSPQHPRPHLSRRIAFWTTSTREHTQSYHGDSFRSISIELKRRRQDGLRPGHASWGRARMRCRRQYGKPRQQFTNKEI